ncbi:MAG: TldD/PmbA family protein [Defluviitaleaceae bacterium]|nr:TldD/PmbA family protein [Defluviitaleaceae bacterium]
MKKEIYEEAASQGFSDWEIYSVNGSSFEAQILKGQVREYKNSAPSGLSFRGTYNGKMGYAYTEKMESDVVKPLVSMAKENAIIKEEGEVEELFKGSPSYPEIEGLRPALGQVSAAQKIEMAKEMERIALSLDKRVVAADYCIIRAGENRVSIANSAGLDLSDESGNGVAGVVVRVVDGNSTKVGMEIWGGKDFSTFNAEAIAKEAVSEAIKKLGATSIKSGDYKVMFKNEVFANLFSVFLSNFFAETVQKGFSLLKDKVGEQIANPLLTVRDNISHPLSLSAASFDSEGVAVRDKVVIENGVLKTYLYNLKAAKKDGTQSTGNGFKSSFKGDIRTNVNNFFIEAGKTPFEEMMKSFSGVLITDLQGLHSGANSISGDFSLQAEGFLIENGEVVKPVEQITVAGNFYTFLKNITQIADNLHFYPFAQIGSPAVLAEGLKIAGE